MHNLLLLFARIGNLILFVFLEILCIYLIVNYNQSQKSIFLNSSNVFSAALNKRTNNLTNYLQLRNSNEVLADENSKLLENLINLRSQRQLPLMNNDSTANYQLLSAEVINNSVNQKNNRFTLNKGEQDGISKGMGIINNDGLVGIINDVSQNYSTALSILNLRTYVSVRIKRTGDIGELRWDGKSIKKMNVNAIPPQVEVIQGDSIVTSGFSTIFPPDIYIGSATKVEKDKRSGFLTVEVDLNNNLSSLDFVYVIKNNRAREQKALENNE